MAILITGGAGFIGSHLAETLQKRGEEVYLIDDFNDYYDPKIKRENADSVLGFGKATLFEGDIRDNAFLERIPFDKVETIIHLAARAGVRASIEEPQLYWSTNVMGTMNLFEMAKEHEINRFVMASSSSVYGDNSEPPFLESNPVMHPVSPYAASKKATELMAHTYCHLYGMHVTCLRYFTVYGPRQRPDMAIHKFAKLMMEDKPIPMFGDGTMRRDFTYIDDIVHGTIAAMEHLGGYRIYNIGESQTIALKTLIDEIGNAIGKTPKINQLPMQPGDVFQTYADISLARAELGYDPKVKVKEGLARFAEWFFDYYEKKKA